MPPMKSQNIAQDFSERSGQSKKTIQRTKNVRIQATPSKTGQNCKLDVETFPPLQFFKIIAFSTKTFLKLTRGKHYFYYCANYRTETRKASAKEKLQI